MGSRFLGFDLIVGFLLVGIFGLLASQVAVNGVYDKSFFGYVWLLVAYFIVRIIFELLIFYFENKDGGSLL